MEIEKRIKQSRIMNAIAILTGVMGIVFIFLKEVFLGYEVSSPSMTNLVPVAFIMMSVSVLLLNYLRSGQIFGDKRNATDELMREELSVLRKELKNCSNFNRHGERLFEEVQLLKEKFQTKIVRLSFLTKKINAR